MLLLAAGAPALAIPIQLEYRGTTYQVLASDTFDDLLAAHAAATPNTTTTIDAIENLTASAYASGLGGDYSTLITTTLDIATPGLYTFQVGTDWGRGGGWRIFDDTSATVVSEFVTASDIWWANDWSNPDVLSVQVDLQAGESYTLQWLGFEGCCAGATTIRFAYESGAFQTLSTPNAAPYVVPEPATGLLLGIGLAGLAIHRR